VAEVLAIDAMTPRAIEIAPNPNAHADRHAAR
jgi:hypothetical protein